MASGREQPGSFTLQMCLQLGENLRGRNIAALAAGALHQLHLSISSASAHHHPPGNAQQIGVLELHAGSLAAVIQQHIDASSLEGAIQLFAELQLRVLWEEILQRFDRIDVQEEPERVFSSFVHGYTKLPVTVTRR